MSSHRFRVASCAIFVFVLWPYALFAHPLGNFTINHLSKFRFTSNRVDLRYVLDMAEIPTYQVMREASASGTMTPAQVEAWARTQAPQLIAQLALTQNGRPVQMTIDRTAARTRPGAGGLPLLYVTVDAHAPLPAVNASRTFSYTDGTYAGRLGWHDIVVAPATEPTNELLSYPSALIGSPRNVLAAQMSVAPAGIAVVTSTSGADDSPGGAPPSAVRSNQLSDMLAKGTSDWTFVLLTFLVAIALGALHALEPGHGKTLLAISLVGARATVKQATILATALTVAHTIGVIALGVAINLLKGRFVPEAIYPWITLVSGVAIAVIGARAIQRQILARRPLAHVHAHGHVAAHAHDHAHVHHAHAADAHDHHHHGDHDHAHGHDHDHTHDDLEHARLHAIPGTAPLSFGGTVWAAMSGGVAPCPAALVVLLAAIALNQVTYGIFVIVAFSFGLAATLTGLGIGVVRGASWLQSRRGFDRFVRYGPLASALVISTIGTIMVGQGFTEEHISLTAGGTLVSQVVVSLLVALAIAGYAFSHPFAHNTGETA